MATLWIAAYAVLSTMRLQLEKDIIRYRYGFIRRQFVLSDLLGVRFEFRPTPFKPTMRLVLDLKRGRTQKADVCLNVWSFDVGELRQWMDTVHARLGISKR
jgi:hypothetical protein